MKINIYLAIAGAALAYTIGMLLGVDIGEDRATYSIAYQCVHENTFKHDGYAFYCVDEDDYYAPQGALGRSPTLSSLDSSARGYGPLTQHPM